MKKLINITILCTVMMNLCKTAFTQNLQDFTGIYAVTQRCWEFNNNFEEITEYEVEVNIATNDSTNLEVKVVMFEPYTLGFNAKNDSMFWIYGHVFLREDSITHDVGGNGVIYKDSIDLNLGVNHFSSNATDSYRCDCNGNKVRDVPLGISENNVLNKAISLYPNPVKEELKVLWPILSGKIYNYYRIFNTNGQSVLENKNQSFESIDVSSLPNGTYIIHFLNDETSTTVSKRFIKVE